ncbi:hypothetical protein [Streptomyces sp. NPDC047525]|uniref:hypothetical protein n=1 Tax=Streptomyces sp. NPDC047525 TaxID=3155264 RepID=UPI0034079DEB
MVVHLSLVVVLAVVVAILIRSSGLKPWHAVLAVLLGFYLRESSLAPSISRAVQSVADAMARLIL